MPFFERKNFKLPSEMTKKFVLNHLTYCATMLGDNFGKETVYKIKLDFIVYFDRSYVTTLRCPITP